MDLEVFDRCRFYLIAPLHPHKKTKTKNVHTHSPMTPFHVYIAGDKDPGEYLISNFRPRMSLKFLFSVCFLGYCLWLKHREIQDR